MVHVFLTTIAEGSYSAIGLKLPQKDRAAVVPTKLPDFANAKQRFSLVFY